MERLQVGTDTRSTRRILDSFLALTSRRFKPGEGPSRGLLCDCEIFPNLRFSFEALIYIQALHHITHCYKYLYTFLGQLPRS